jgi:hypothetical protein
MIEALNSQSHASNGHNEQQIGVPRRDGCNIA